MNKYYCGNELLNPDGSRPWKWGSNSDNAKKYKIWVKSALKGIQSSKKEKRKHQNDIHYFENNMGKLCRGLSNLSGCFHQLGQIVTSKKPEWEQISMIMNLRDHHNRPFINQETAKDIYDTMHMKYIQVGKGRGSDFDDYGEPYCYEKHGGAKGEESKKEEAEAAASAAAAASGETSAEAARIAAEAGRDELAASSGAAEKESGSSLGDKARSGMSAVAGFGSKAASGAWSGLKTVGGLAASGAAAGARGISKLGSKVMGSGGGRERDDEDYDDEGEGEHHHHGHDNDDGGGIMSDIDESAGSSLDNIAQDAGNFQGAMNCLGAKLGVQMTNYANQMKQGAQMQSYYDGVENDVNTLPFLHKGFSGGISKEFDIPLNLNDILLMGFSVFPFLGWILDIFMIFRAILEKRWIYAILMVLNWFQWFFWKLFTMGMLNVDLGPFFKLFYVAPYASYFFNAKNIMGTASDLMLEFSGNLPTMISVMMN